MGARVKLYMSKHRHHCVACAVAMFFCSSAIALRRYFVVIIKHPPALCRPAGGAFSQFTPIAFFRIEGPPCVRAYCAF
jgi:hypothetical protein